MKKKAIKIAASTAVAASAFVAAAPVQQADAATNLDQLATNAANAGTVLKWAISKEGSADYQTRPYDEYNAAKKAIKALETAIEKLPANQKLAYQAKLVEPKIQVNRALAYIDALTSGEKIRTKQAELQAAINNNDLKAVNEKYHILTAEIRKQAILLYDVYGESTRAGILAQFKAPAETLYRSVSNDVTVYMHLDKASKLTPTDVVKASEELAKAQALLNDKKISFKWHAALTKNAADVAAALPLQVVSVGYTGKNTVVVKFSKEYGAVLEAGQFTVNGVTVQSAKLSDDKKTVTLTTSNLDAAKEYTVTWKGATVGKFTTAAEIDTRGISFDQTSVARLETSQTRTFESTLVNADNSAYVGPVVITLVDVNGDPLPSTNPALITSLNGSTVASKVLPSNTDKNGKLVVTISAGANLDGASATGVYVKVTKDTNGNGTVEAAEASTISAGTHFYKLASNDQNTAFNVTSNFIDKDNDYIYDSATNKLKYKWDANDKFFIQNVLVTQAEFEAALSNGDKLTVDYKSNVNNVSSWNITEDVTLAGEVEITNPAKATVTYDGVNYRLQGTGDPGFVVSVYRGTSNSGVYIDRATVDASGNWSVVVPNLVQNQSNVFTVYQHRAGDSVKSTDNKDSVTINEGAFASTGIKLIDNGDNGLSVTDVLEFSFLNSNFGHKFNENVTAGTFTLTDGQSQSATITVKNVGDNRLEVTKVEKDANSTFNFKSSTISITSASGVVNNDQLAYNVAASTGKTLGVSNSGVILSSGVVTRVNTTSGSESIEVESNGTAVEYKLTGSARALASSAQVGDLISLSFTNGNLTGFTVVKTKAELEAEKAIADAVKAGNTALSAHIAAGGKTTDTEYAALATKIAANPQVASEITAATTALKTKTDALVSLNKAVAAGNTALSAHITAGGKTTDAEYVTLAVALAAPTKVEADITTATTNLKAKTDALIAVSKAVSAVSAATTVASMQTALETNAVVLGLTLTDYNTLSGLEKEAVAQKVLDAKPLADNGAIVAAFNAAVAAVK